MMSLKVLIFMHEVDEGGTVLALHRGKLPEKVLKSSSYDESSTSRISRQ